MPTSRTFFIFAILLQQPNICYRLSHRLGLQFSTSQFALGSGNAGIDYVLHKFDRRSAGTVSEATKMVLKQKGWQLEGNGAVIPIVDSAKDLGVTITAVFKTSLHCRGAAMRPRSVLFQMCRGSDTRDIPIPIRRTRSVHPGIRLASLIFLPSTGHRSDGASSKVGYPHRA